MFQNVSRLLYFSDSYHFSSADNRFHFEQFENDHAFHADGVNWYIGITTAHRQQLKQEYGAEALNQGIRNWEVRFLSDFVTWLESASQLEKWVVFALEPRETALQSSPFNPQHLTDYAYVQGNKAWLKAMATRLKEFQDMAKAAGKTFSIVIRFGSEMNAVGDSGNTWAGKPSAFRSCYKFIYDIFKGVSPDFKFCFSPALRADINTVSKYPRIRQHYPGDDVVDIVSGTWYVHPTLNKKAGLDILQRYYEDFAAPAGKPMALDEMGIRDGVGDKDPLFQEMFGTLASVSHIGALEYVTLFLAKGLALDAPLAFLRDPHYVPWP